MDIVRAIQKDSKDAAPIQELCEQILSNIGRESSKNDTETVNEQYLCQLENALSLFTLSSRHWSARRHALTFDLLRTSLRNINESCHSETIRNVTITKIITVFGCISEQRSQQSQIVIDICSVLVEISTNFSQSLSIQQTIEIIEICHSQIRMHIIHGQNGDGGGGVGGGDSTAKKLFLNHLQALQSKLRPSSFGTKSGCDFHDTNLEFENFVLSDDTVLSAINLAGSQVCHAFTKNRILAGSGRHLSSSSSSSISGTSTVNQETRARAQVSQDFAHLLAYLSHKLKMKQSFWHTLALASKTIGEESAGNGGLTGSGAAGGQTKSSTTDGSTINKTNWTSGSKRAGDYFVLVKVYSCFYLKCIHYTVLTIPDAWPLMSSQLIEIVCRNVTPILMDTLIPMSRISGVKQQQQHQQQQQSQQHQQQQQTQNLGTHSDFGRGSESLVNNGSSSSSASYQTLVKTVAYQERNSIYKISLELLRLFGLERSMRPLLEALFHRIFLLPNNEQRVESLVFMQDVLRNPLLVLVLMSNPLCLYGFSSSHSGSLDLFKIFIDAINEAQQSGHSLLMQLSSLCFTILISTMDCLAKLNTTKSLEFLSSPTARTILNYAQQNRLLYEITYLFQNSSTSNKYRKTKQKNAVNDLQNIKSRIYGYDAKNSQYVCSKKQQSIPSMSDTKGYFLEDFNYSLRLSSLINKQPKPLSDSSQDSIPSKPIYHLSLENLDRFGSERFECSGTLRTAQSDDSLWRKKNDSVSRIFVDLNDTTSEHSVFVDIENESGPNRMARSSSSSVLSSSTSTSSTPSSSSKKCSKFMMKKYNNPQNGEDKEEEEDDDDDDDDEDDDDDREVNSATIAHFERSLATIFIRKLRELLPELVKKQSLLLADDILQSFASNYCRDLYRALKYLNTKTADSPVPIIGMNASQTLNDLTPDEIDILQASSHLVDSLFVNADGIYLSIYSALLLNLKLLYRGYYQSHDPSLIPLSEKEFIDEIYDYRIAVYLSPHFLAEIYQRIVTTSLLDFFDVEECKFETIPLIKLLQDVDILDESKPNAYKLSEYTRLECTMQNNPECKHASCDAMHAIIRRFLAHFWNNLMELFVSCTLNSVAPTFKQSVQVLSNVNKSHLSVLCSALHVQSPQQLGMLKLEDACLLTMHSLLNLCLHVSFYHEMDRFYENFIQSIKRSPHVPATVQSSGTGRMTKSATLPELGDRVLGRIQPTAAARTELLSPVRLYCIKALLNNSATVGSHCSKIWPKVFEICTFVLELEISLFRSSHSTLLSRARISIGSILKSNSISQSLSSATILSSVGNTSEHNNNDDFNVSQQNLRSFANLPGISENESLNLETQFDALISSLIRHGSSLELVKNSTALEQLVEFLSYFVGQIFETFALKFNLALLGVFVQELCDFSRQQLVSIEQQQQQQQQQKQQSGGSNFGSGNTNKTLMLFRLVEVLLRFVRNGRPLLHFMRVWPVAAGHLIECCTVQDSTISKRAITSLHDIINAALSAYGEPDFFNFNESIFSCYEKLLLHELCDNDASEELLLNSICEFVEGAPTEIRSGWRPIFRALRGLRTQLDCHESSSRIVLLSDIFDAYLRTENLHVFSYASADFVACTFHLVRGAAAEMPIKMHESTFITLLKYIQRFCKILRTINAFSDCGTQSEQRLIVSPLIRGRKYKLIQLDRLRRALLETLNTDRKKSSFDAPGPGDVCDCEEQQNLDSVLAHFDLNLQLNTTVRLGDLVDSSRPTPLLQLWSLILEEFGNTILAADLHHRPMLLEVFLPLLGTCSDLDPSRQFVIFVSNHIVMPLMQSLLSETLDTSRCKDVEENCKFLRQWLPIFVKHILRHVKSYHERNNGLLNDACLLLLKQSLLVTVECLNPDYHDLISWLALSLFYDILDSDIVQTWIGPSLWTIIIDCYQIGHQLSLSSLKSLVHCFDCIPLENDLERLKILSLRIGRSSKFVRTKACQVFFVQKADRCLVDILSADLDADQKQGDDRDFHILVESNSGVQKCVPFNQLARETHCHHYLTRIMVNFLTTNLSPGLEMLCPTLFGSCTVASKQRKSLSDTLSVYQYQRLCTMFKASRDYSIQFDRRPGLKFLIQQICLSQSPANLYQLSVMTWIVQFVVDFRFAINDHHFSQTIGELFHDCFADYRSKMEFKQRLFGTESGRPLTFSMLPTILLKSDVISCPRTASATPNDTESCSPNTVTHPLRSNPFDDSDTVQFHLFSDDNLNQIIGDFRRSKDLFSNPNQTSNGTPTMLSSAADAATAAAAAANKDTIKDCFLTQDFETFFSVWNEIFANCITLHANLPSEQFHLVLTQFRILFRQLFMVGDVSPEIRQSMQAWIDKIIELLLSKKI